ncbi:MAG: hypothetical protein DI631_07425 [Acinetobacter johnsonii]|nr:MAG: hypothetical protein DI631_07425 [Acinetobacter johnsonii]
MDVAVSLYGRDAISGEQRHFVTFVPSKVKPRLRNDSANHTVKCDVLFSSINKKAPQMECFFFTQSKTTA